MIKITCFGEVLWDLFPTNRQIGGAPLNVALRLQSLDNDVSIISSVGQDENGDEILRYLEQNNLKTETVQIDENLATGNVNVTLDEKGSASYDIKFPRAWDNIQLMDKSKSLIETSDAFIFGSLIARNDTSRNTLYELLKLSKYKIFDINLRAPYYTDKVLAYLMNEADFIKFNEDEFVEVNQNLNTENQTLEQNIIAVAEQTNTQCICITKGGDGATLFVKGQFYYHRGYHVKVADTVGAGDSFLASLINGLLKEEEPQKALNFACAVGALVASREGANPKIEKEEIGKLLSQGNC